MTRRQAVLGLAVVALVWGVSFTLIKETLRDVSPVAFLAVRFTLAAILVAGWWRGITRAELRAGALLGVFFWGGFVFQTQGLAYTTPSRSAFITGISTPLVPLVAYLVDRVLPRPVMLVGVVLAGAGMYLLTAPGGAGGLNRGDLLTGGCAVLFACQIVTAGHYAQRCRPERLLVVQLTLTAVLSALAASWVEVPRLALGRGSLLALLFLSVSAVATFWFQLRAQREVSPAQTALVFTLEPLCAAVTSYLVLGETLGAVQWAGGALILFGTALPEARARAAIGAPAPPPSAT